MDKWVGKIAVVTGAASGIGAAITEALSDQGVIVVGLDIRKSAIEELAKTSKSKIYALECNVTKPEAVDLAFDWIEETVGGVDILVNCAGVGNNAKLFDLSKSSDYYLETINVNIGGYLLVARRAFKTMQQMPFGYVINISSTFGQWSTSPALVKFGINIYGATKHAIAQLSAIMKLEFDEAEKNIRVTNVSPGAVYTNLDLASDMPRPKEGRLWDVTPHLQPSDIADQIVYLLSTKPSVNISELTVEPVGKINL